MKLVIATPLLGASPYAADVAFGYAEARARVAALYPAELIPASVGFSADVVRARNRLAAHVLRELPDVTHVLWWDADNWPEDVRLIQAMIDTGADVIGAPYVRKRRPVRWVHRFASEEPVVESLGGHAVLEVAGVGFGFTITSRCALESISAVADSYRDAPHEHMIANIFGQVLEPVDADDEKGPRILLSEDFSFCHRWRKDLRGKVYVYAAKGNMMAHAGPVIWTARDMDGGVE